MIAGVIASNAGPAEGFLERFASDDLTVFDDAWKLLKKTFFKGLTRTPGAVVQQLKTPLKAPPVGGKPKESETPKDERDVLSDAHEAAMAILDSRGGEG